MTKNRDNVTNISSGTTADQTAPVVEAPVPSANYALAFRRNHPGNRCSYGIAGNSGIVVFDRGLVAGTVPTTSESDLGGMPASITMDCELVQPKADNKTAKVEEAARKAQEKADKAAKRAADAQAKIAERAAKAADALAKAQAKVAAATGTAAAAPEVPATE